MDHAAGVKPRLPRRLRLFRQRAVTLHRQQRHPPPRGLCQTRNDISVAAVVAMSAEDQPVRAGRISAAGQLERRLARALHEFEQRQPGLSAASRSAGAAPPQAKCCMVYCQGFSSLYGPSCHSPSISFS